jgi:hypothetical protein
MRDTNTAQTWFLAREAAAYCRISPRTLARWRSAGRIRHYGGRYFRDDLDRAVRNPVPEPVLEERDAVRFSLSTRVTDAMKEGLENLSQAPSSLPLGSGHVLVPPVQETHTSTNYVDQGSATSVFALPIGCTCRWVPDYSTPDAPSMDLEPNPTCPVCRPAP